MWTSHKCAPLGTSTASWLWLVELSSKIKPIIQILLKLHEFNWIYNIERDMSIILMRSEIYTLISDYTELKLNNSLTRLCIFC